jgi:archaellum biogenesis ATPase FlaH
MNGPHNVLIIISIISVLFAYGTLQNFIRIHFVEHFVEHFVAFREKISLTLMDYLNSRMKYIIIIDHLDSA